MTPRHAVAVIADAHVHDPEARLGGTGLVMDGRRLFLRPWHDVATCARAVNESAAAFRTALDRIVALGLRHVVLLGDYTDEGQVATTCRLGALLRTYRARHALRFYAIPGNHDVFGPLGLHNTIGYATAPDRFELLSSDPAHPDARHAPALRRPGQPAGLMPLAACGLFRDPADLHWESPFGPDDRPDRRLYDATAADGSVTHRLMDASYLVEPEPGLWLLMLDANVFEPTPGRRDPSRKRAFRDPANAGWNAVLRVKPFLIDWIARVTARADSLGKTLMAFSHHPALDPYDDRAGTEAALFPGGDAALRTPGPDVATGLARAGLCHHVSGHLHAAGTTVTATPHGPLTNVALPALCAWPPAFGIVSGGRHGLSTKMISLADMPLDARLMALYRQSPGPVTPALSATRLGPFLAAQARARTLALHIPQDWPPGLAARVMAADLSDLVHLLAGPDTTLTPGRADPAARDWIARTIGPDLAAFPLADLIADTVLMRQAGPLTGNTVPGPRRRAWQTLADTFADPRAEPGTDAGFLRLYLARLGLAARRADEGHTA